MVATKVGCSTGREPKNRMQPSTDVKEGRMNIGDGETDSHETADGESQPSRTGEIGDTGDIGETGGLYDVNDMFQQLRNAQNTFEVGAGVGVGAGAGAGAGVGVGAEDEEGRKQEWWNYFTSQLEEIKRQQLDFQ